MKAHELYRKFLKKQIFCQKIFEIIFPGKFYKFITIKNKIVNSKKFGNIWIFANSKKIGYLTEVFRNLL
ncbi:hypothetical protein BLM37_02365 [Candidatus Gracilibacteria bacterium GN02-873]|nr:hypothetical protein BLM37_02365 [Candidatus Gracilibacteria bacterium GN02-873]